MSRTNSRNYQAHRRRWRNLLINRSFQLRFAAAFILNFLLGLVLIPWVLGEYFMTTNVSEVKIGNQTIISTVPDGDRVLINAVLLLLAYNIFSAMIAIFISHRLAGPMVAIRRHVNKLCEGDLSSRVFLRKNDEFRELADDLNRLAERMETDKRSPQR